MGNPHNPLRYGETWSDEMIEVMTQELEIVQHLAIISGGWAWHFLSEPHAEYKHLHDHKDIDIYVPPKNVGQVIGNLCRFGYEKVPTRFDMLADDFRRYQKFVDGHKIIFDFFVGEPPFVDVGGWMVVEPETLLSYYTEGHHGSSECWSVANARKILKANEDVARNPKLTETPIG